MTDPRDLPHTYAWACETGGRLTVAQKATVRAGIRAGYVDIARGLAGRLFHRPPAVDVEAPPDSRLTRTAVEAAAEQLPAIVGHGYRTWMLGSALASADRQNVDAELLYVTSLLHDSGMMREVAGQDFTVRSAELLLDVFARAGEPETRGLLAADAAVAHASPGLSVADDPVGFYVQAGAMADLAGLRMWDLPGGLLARAYREHPAAGVHQSIPTLIRREARDVPDGRFALLRRAGMDRIVQASPTRFYAR
ncbi:MAG: hypothetical protein LLG14_21165 [Nocardiaceae bacterium]|nr:hypothetical protein [Nocardiaceae bacterium]